MNAAAEPPAPPTLRRVTAGWPVAVLALLYSSATTWVPTWGVYRSAVPWNCMVELTIPSPGAVLVSTLM